MDSSAREGTYRRGRLRCKLLCAVATAFTLLIMAMIYVVTANSDSIFEYLGRFSLRLDIHMDYFSEKSDQS